MRCSMYCKRIYVFCRTYCKTYDTSFKRHLSERVLTAQNPVYLYLKEYKLEGT